MYVRLFGQKAPLKIAYWISQIEKQYANLEKTVCVFLESFLLFFHVLVQNLSDDLRQKYQQRCKKAMSSGNGKWDIPPPILDEKQFLKDLAENMK